MSYYWCWNTKKFVYNNSSPEASESGFLVKPTYNNKSVESNCLYRSTYTSISEFRSTQRFIFGSSARLTEKSNIHIYYTTTTSFYNNQVLTLTNDITNRFKIKVLTDTIIDITPLSTVSGSNLTLFVDFDNELGLSPSTFGIITNFENCTLISGNLKGYQSGSTFSLEIGSDSRYRLPDTISYSTSYINDLKYTLNEDKTTATINGVITGNATISVTAILVCSVSITGTFKNCTCNYSDGEIITNDKPNIILTANNGYEFDGKFSYSQGSITDFFNNSTDKTTLTTSISNGYNYVLDDKYTAIKKVEKIGNFANLYYTNENELTELSKVRFVNANSGTVDYGSFITALYLLPFPIDTTLLAKEKSNIILGNYDSNVKSTRFITYKIEVDGGTITIPEKYKNVYDFLNTECILHLPFFNKMYINTEYVIGHTLTIKYIIDLYTGNVTTNVYSSFVNDIIETQTQQIAENIPFIQKQTNSVVGTISNINKNVIDTSYIEIVRNIPYDSKNVFGRETIDYGVIGAYTGYIRVSDVVLQTTATIDEKEEIIQLLKEGVFL